MTPLTDITAATREEAGEALTTYDRMSETIAGIMQSTGGCVPQDMIAKGFTYEEIERYWPMAKALAHVRLNLMDA